MEELVELVVDNPLYLTITLERNIFPKLKSCLELPLWSPPFGLLDMEVEKGISLQHPVCL